ncbi:MAG: radical SAM protein [Planctomycetes bacterium]|nr:radical SAM protein [Planctomycetota bacterium]
MVILERRSRKGPVLTPSSLPCLKGVPAVNITEGCAHGCTYCYTQGYSAYPGAGRVILFENTPDLVCAELTRKRRRPRRVYFSPSSDAFQPMPEVQDVTFRTMEILLEAGVEVAFLTKGRPDERFLTLFCRRPSLVFAQIGITTLNEDLWRKFEGGAAPPARRLEIIDNLTRGGVMTKVRFDPLIPDLTDTETNLASLLVELEHRKIRDVAASYLFLRPAFARRLALQMRQAVGKADLTRDWTWRRLADGVGGGYMIGPEERDRRFDRLQKLAAQYGIDVHVCACKNPDLTVRTNCRIAGPLQDSLSDEAMPLFQRATRCY